MHHLGDCGWSWWASYHDLLVDVEPELASQVRDLTDGLTYLHGQNPPIRHGDLKTVLHPVPPIPFLFLMFMFNQGNVVINAEKRAMLADFGLSEVLMEGPTGLTTSETFKGTLRYCSP